MALAVGVAVVLLPWVARNHAVHGRFVLTAAHGGVTFWTGNNPLARGEGDLAANPDMKRARNALEAGHPGLTAQEMDGVYYREAFAFIGTRRWSGSRSRAKKLFYTVVPIGPSYLLHSRRYRLGSWIPYATSRALCDRRRGPSRPSRVGPLARSVDGRVGRPHEPRVLPAGTVPHPGDRSDPRHLRRVLRGASPGARSGRTVAR